GAVRSPAHVLANATWKSFLGDPQLLVPALVARLAFIAVQAIALVAGLTFVTLLAVGRGGNPFLQLLDLEAILPNFFAWFHDVPRVVGDWVIVTQGPAALGRAGLHTFRATACRVSIGRDISFQVSRKRNPTVNDRHGPEPRWGSAHRLLVGL